LGKFCEVCNKGLMHGNNVSHSVRRTHRVWAPNTQRVRVVVDGVHKHLYVCTRCLRSGKVTRAV
jgi:large subunit ribosomal protein L28